MPARSIFWRLANSGVPGAINEALGTDQLVTVTGVGSNTGIQINLGDGNWRSYTTLPGEVPDNIRAGTIQNPSLAMSLGPLRQEGPRPFVNQFKMGEPWQASMTAGGSQNYATLLAAGHINANGGIIRIPAGMDNMVSYQLQGMRPQMGGGTRWRLMWDGQGDVRVNGPQNVNNDTPGQIDFDFTANGQNMVVVLVVAVTAGPIENFRLVNLDDMGQLVVGNVFRDQYLEEIRNYRCIRFDNWVDIVQNQTTTWASRSVVSEEFWVHDQKRIPLEVCVDLCNAIGADMWLCLPYRATNDYISQSAIMVRDRLNTARHCYIEYAHKCWDFATPAAQYCGQQGDIMFAPAQGGENFIEWYGVQSANVARLWRAAWGSTNRLKCVAQTQADWLGLEQAMLNAPRWVAQQSGRQPPHTVIDAYGIHAQIDGNMAYGERYAMIEGWRTTLTETQVFDRIRDQSLTAAWAPTTERTVQNSITRWQYHRETADGLGMELVCVDGGSHLHAGGPAMSNPAHLAMLGRYHWSPQFAQVAQAILNGWEQIGGDLFSWSVHSRIPEDTINVGLQRWEGDHNLIWDVVYGWNVTVEGPTGRGLAFVGPFDTTEGVVPVDPEEPIDPEEPVDPEEPEEPEEPGTPGPVMTALATSEPLGFAGHSSVGEIFDGGNFDGMWSGTIRSNIIGGDIHSDDLWNANGPERNNPVGMILISEMDESPVGRYADPAIERGRTNLQYHYWYGLTAANQNAEMILFWHPTPRHSYDVSFEYNRSMMNYYRQWLSDKIGQTVWVMPADLYVSLLRQGGMSDTQVWRDDYHLADNVGGVGPKTGLGFMLYRMLTGQVPAVTAGNEVYHAAAMAALAQYRWGGTGGSGNDQVFSVTGDPLPSPLPLPGGTGPVAPEPGVDGRVLLMRAGQYDTPTFDTGNMPVEDGNIMEFSAPELTYQGANLNGVYAVVGMQWPANATEIGIPIYFGGQAGSIAVDPYFALEVQTGSVRVMRYPDNAEVSAATAPAAGSWVAVEWWQFGTQIGISINGVDATLTTTETAPATPGIAISVGMSLRATYLDVRDVMPSLADRSALRGLALSLAGSTPPPDEPEEPEEPVLEPPVNGLLYRLPAPVVMDGANVQTFSLAAAGASGDPIYAAVRILPIAGAQTKDAANIFQLRTSGNVNQMSFTYRESLESVVFENDGGTGQTVFALYPAADVTARTPLTFELMIQAGAADNARMEGERGAASPETATMDLLTGAVNAGRFGTPDWGGEVFAGTVLDLIVYNRIPTQAERDAILLDFAE